MKKTKNRRKKRGKEKNQKAKNSQLSPNQDFVSPGAEKYSHRGNIRRFDRER